VPASTVSIGCGARLRPPPSGAPSIVKRWPLPVAAENAIPLAGSQSIVHSMIVHLSGRYCTAAKNTLHSISVGRRRGFSGLSPSAESIVSSTSSIGGFRPKAAMPWAFFLIPQRSRQRGSGEAAAYDAAPQSSAARKPHRHGDTAQEILFAQVAAAASAGPCRLSAEGADGTRLR